jgi:splicing factor 1
MTGITKDGRQLDALDEPLHALVTAATAEDVKKGVKEVQDVIDMYVYRPDCEKAVALRAKHMHELSVLNGTLKDIDLKCLNCGRPGHKSWECDDSKIFTASVICSACGGVGHVSKSQRDLI